MSDVQWRDLGDGLTAGYELIYIWVDFPDDEDSSIIGVSKIHGCDLEDELLIGVQNESGTRSIIMDRVEVQKLADTLVAWLKEKEKNNE